MGALQGPWTLPSVTASTVGECDRPILGVLTKCPPACFNFGMARKETKKRTSSHSSSSTGSPSSSRTRNRQGKREKGGFRGGRGKGGSTVKKDARSGKPSKRTILAAEVVVRSSDAGKTLTSRETDYASKVVAEGIKNPTDSPQDSRQLDKPNVREAIISAFAKVGLTPEAIASKIRDGMDAKETKFFQHEGKITDQIDVEAHGVQHRYLTTAIEVLGGKQGEVKEIHHRHFVYQSNLGEEPEIINVTPPTEGAVKNKMATQRPMNRPRA